MRYVLRLFLSVILLSGFLLPSEAVILQPGTYKLAWTTSEDISKTTCQFLELDLAPQDNGVPAINGLKSAKYLRCGPDEDCYLRMVLDESKGTGKGYDVAYISLAASGKLTDVAQAIKLPLRKSNNAPLMWKDVKVLESDKFTLDIPYTSSNIIRKTTISLEIDIFDDGNITGTAAIKLWSGWSGVIKTDGEDLKVILDDQNADGLFEKNSSNQAIDGTTPCLNDYIWIGRHNGQCECGECKSFMLGGVSSYDNKLYIINVKPSGEEIEIKPYTGPSGTVILNAIDGYNKPAKCGATIHGKEGFFKLLDNGKETQIPAGVYKTSPLFIIEPEQNKASDKRISIFQRANLEITVQPEKAVTIDAGGPVTLSINSEKDAVTAKAGQEIKISLDIKIKDEKAVILSEKNPVISIYNSAGKLLKSGKGEFG
ncbi:MAG: hypothetical protein ABFD46_05215 [Armatimonadota bacterium]